MEYKTNYDLITSLGQEGMVKFLTCEEVTDYEINPMARFLWDLYFQWYDYDWDANDQECRDPQPKPLLEFFANGHPVELITRWWLMQKPSKRVLRHFGILKDEQLDSEEIAEMFSGYVKLL